MIMPPEFRGRRSRRPRTCNVLRTVTAERNSTAHPHSAHAENKKQNKINQCKTKIGNTSEKRAWTTRVAKRGYLQKRPLSLPSAAVITADGRRAGATKHLALRSHRRPPAYGSPPPPGTPAAAVLPGLSHVPSASHTAFALTSRTEGRVSGVAKFVTAAHPSPCRSSHFPLRGHRAWPRWRYRFLASHRRRLHRLAHGSRDHSPQCPCLLQIARTAAAAAALQRRLPLAYPAPQGRPSSSPPVVAAASAAAVASATAVAAAAVAVAAAAGASAVEPMPSLEPD